MRKSVAALLLVGGLVLTLSATPAIAASPSLPGANYVALGDSYSAGYGILPYSSTTPANGCYQAEANYPHLIAEELGLDLDDRTCSGAVTANIRDTPQVTDGNQGTAPVQGDYLSEDTDIVTVTIGGNDLGFATVAADCLSVNVNGPAIGHNGYNTCKAYYNPSPGVDSLLTLLDGTVVPALDETFDLIADKAPNAKVFVVGYPTIAPDLANTPLPQPPGCFVAPATQTGFTTNSFPYQQVDSLYLHDIEFALDSAIRTAAEDHDFTFVPTWTLSQQNSACSEEPFINGVTLSNSPTDARPTPISGLYLVLGALHPNAAGVAFLDEQISAAILAAYPDPAPAQLAATGAAPALAIGAGALLFAVGAVLLVRRRVA